MVPFTVISGSRPEWPGEWFGPVSGKTRYQRLDPNPMYSIPVKNTC